MLNAYVSCLLSLDSQEFEFEKERESERDTESVRSGSSKSHKGDFPLLLRGRGVTVRRFSGTAGQCVCVCVSARVCVCVCVCTCERVVVDISYSEGFT